MRQSAWTGWAGARRAAPIKHWCLGKVLPITEIARPPKSDGISEGCGMAEGERALIVGAGSGSYFPPFAT